VLLALGLGGRLAAGVLFQFNIVAVVSYPALGPAGLEQHQVWGLMLAVTLLHGPGKISLDHWLRRRFLGQ
jgi:putative oxidoreductase